MDPEKYFVKKPAYEVKPGNEAEGRSPVMTMMSRDLVPGIENVYIETSWIVGMPDPNPPLTEHSHDHDEIILFYGSDPNNTEDLGGEYEFVFDGKPVTIDSTTAIYVPKGVKHGPLTCKRFDRPQLLMTVMLGAGTLAEANPGGYIESQGE